MAARTRTSFWTLALPRLVVRITPRWFQIFLSQILGSVAYCLFGRVRRALVGNLTQVTGNPFAAKRLARQTFIHYCIYIADYMTFHRLDEAQIEKLVPEVRGGENVARALEKKKGIILVTPHLGNWELAGIWLSRRNHRLHVVSLTDEDERTEEYRNRMRDTHGIRLLRYDPRSASMASMVEMVNVLRKNEFVAMLTDRPAAERTETVDFFGRPARFPVGAFILSWLSGAPVMPCRCVLRDDRTYTLVTDDPILLDRDLDRDESIRRGVMEMARRYESYVRAHPDQWYNFYPYWNEMDPAPGSASPPTGR